MQGLTFRIEPEGLRVSAVLAPPASVLRALQSQGLPFPPLSHVKAVIDTGSTMTAVGPSALAALGATPIRTGSTQTASSPSVPVSIYEIGFGIYDPRLGAGVQLTRGTWEVTDLPHDIPDVDVLFGMDLLREIHLHVDGPGGTFTIEFDP